ncbi:MAG TPA: FAD-dependent oxidoreductase, partial [Sandaracinaceae bacterium]
MKSNRIVVVGGGLTGLAAAVDAAARGAEVLVVERTAELGGRGRSDGPEGYALNLGPHALYPRAADLLARLGVRVAGSPPALARFTMRIGDRVEPLPSSALTLLSNGALSSAGKWAVARVLATAYLGDPRPLDPLTVSEWLSGLPADARAVV